MMVNCASVPDFAIVGHPNEGKSSVVSTLSEDDSVRVSPVPGETTECRAFPVRIDGREVIRFIDTPGFQNPRKTLAWMRAWQGDDLEMLNEFIRAHRDDPAMHDDCALLAPLAAGAGIIFVVDGSRPLRNMDKAEMEILRLTGRPRMAIINCKDENSSFLADWQNEFRKHFNSIRLFNANKATYSQRIALLQSLKAIDQDLESVIETVIQAFSADWESRREQSAALIVAMLAESLRYKVSASCPTGTDEARLKADLHHACTEFVVRRERVAHQQIRRLFKHNLFNLQLSEQSILQEDLFAAKTWDFLGLNAEDLILAAALSGAAAGVGIDALTAGTSFGLFAAVGGAIGALGAAWKGRDILSGRKLLGVKLDKQQMQVGPVTNIQLLYILLDRALLYFRHVANWAHGRRDYTDTPSAETEEKIGCTATWSVEERNICERFFRALHKEDVAAQEQTESVLAELLKEKLKELAEID
jgi:predicted GTPase